MSALVRRHTSREPVRWNMRWVLTDAAILGLTGVAVSALLLWFAIARLELPRDQLQTLIFLKLLVAGHLTLYVVRVRDWFWRRPWPEWKLFVALEATQILGTLAAVYGWLMAPLGWTLALALWAYALVAMFVMSAVRVLALRTIRPRLCARHVERTGSERAAHADRAHAKRKAAFPERGAQEMGDDNAAAHLHHSPGNPASDGGW